MTDARVQELIALLQMQPHPEGGHYHEVYRSTSIVRPADGRPERSSLTTIYFLLIKGQVSRWHTVRSDEVWHYYEGDPLELFTADPGLTRVTRRSIGPVADGVHQTHTVAGGDWQAARSAGAFTLVGCTVGPGFDFADFGLLVDRPDAAETMRRCHPEYTPLI